MLAILSSPQRRVLALGSAILLLAGLAASGQTASASHSGDGAGAGKYTYDSEPISGEQCGEFKDHDGDGTVLAYEATYTGSATIDGETYTGPFTVTFDDKNEEWTANPSGIYEHDLTNPCSTPTTITVEDVTVKSETAPEEDVPGIDCDGNNVASGNNNGELGRTDTMSDIADVKASCTVSDGDGDTVGDSNNVAIEINSTFAGPCWRDPTTGNPLPMPPTDCVTEDVINFHDS